MRKIRYHQSIIVKQADIWNTENPVLYEVRSVCSVTNGEQAAGPNEITSPDTSFESQDYLNTRFGFRTIPLDADTGFWLNGENMKLKGFCCHQDHAGTGVAVPYALRNTGYGF